MDPLLGLRTRFCLPMLGQAPQRFFCIKQLSSEYSNIVELINSSMNRLRMVKYKYKRINS